MARATRGEELAMAIEQLVRDHMAETHRLAQDAIDRALCSRVSPSASPRPALTKVRTKARAVRNRRPVEELAKLTEGLYTLICTEPGAGMARYAERLGATVRDLNLPVTRLKQEGRLRSVGARNRTRYFPVATDATAAE